MDTEQRLFAQLNPSAIVITPNRRLAATLAKRYRLYQSNAQKKVWETPSILPYQSFLQRLWQDYVAASFQPLPILLSTIQEQLLWENIVSSSHEANQLLQISETANHCLSAFSLLQQWQLDLDDPLFQQTEDTAIFCKWTKLFLQLCAEKNWLPNACLSNFLLPLISQQHVALPKTIYVVGFSEVNPQLKQLLSTCEQQSCRVVLQTLRQDQGNCYRLKFADLDAEIIALARWAKAMINKQPGLTIGCVVPTLDKNRDRIKQLFSLVFATQTNLFNLSAGKPLSHYPIIHSALELLSLTRNLISIDLLSHVLLMPFVGDAEAERMQRATFDVLLRRYNVHRIDLNEQLTNTQNFYYLFKHAPLLAGRLQSFFALLKQTEKTLPYSAWAKILQNLLIQLGWPGERSLNSEEYQTVNQWLTLLSQFTTLDYLVDKVDLTQALATLNKLVSRHIFQPQSPEAPIQILGTLEAAGLTFDYLWVSGMDDLSWPPAPKPNPFLPKSLQRDLNMPHALAERELYFSRLLTKQFQQSAKLTYFSHALKYKEVELQPSFLIRQFPECNEVDLEQAMFVHPQQLLFKQRQLDFYLDVQGPMQLIPQVRGGVNVLKQQALCPFKAFAEWRLFARELEKPLPGLRNKDRGTILHKAMEFIWSSIKTQAALLALAEPELDKIILECVSLALADFPMPLTKADMYLQLETCRLQKLITEWLRLEKKRPSFTVIAQEQQQQIQVQQLQFTIKIDRIDQLENGHKLIIDYKTGKYNDYQKWLGERPEEPQLPLYALHDMEHIIGICFAQIAPGAQKFIGLSRYDINIKGIDCIESTKKLTGLTWAEHLQQWQLTLGQLSTAFYEGQAQVDPKDPVQTCLWCELKPLCRVNEVINFPANKSPTFMQTTEQEITC